MNPGDSGSDLFRSWYQDVLEIKKLFYLRRYKHCAARCEEFKAFAVHPIHKTFLNFYQALSYESLGISAHMYSNNKLPLLNLAKDCFGLALQTLPPSVDVIGRGPGYIGLPALESPACATLDAVSRYQHPSPLTNSSAASPCESDFSIPDRVPGDVEFHVARGRSSSVSSTCSDNVSADIDVHLNTDLACLNLQKRVARHDWSKLYPATPVIVKTTEARNTPITNHKARLNQGLSPDHRLAEELVPSPLFNKCRKGISTPVTPRRSSKRLLHQAFPANVADDHNKSEHEPIPFEAVPGEEHTSQNTIQPYDERPLPPLPFNHKPHFERKGSRHVLVPTVALKSTVKTPRKSRATAIQTLVAKFEGKIQEASPGQISVSPNTSCPVTPITPRFKMIGQIFAIKSEHQGEPEHGSDDQDVGPRTTDGGDTGFADVDTDSNPYRSKKLRFTSPQFPTITPIAITTSSASPPSDLNSHVQTFHTTIKTHLASVTMRIATVETKQQARFERNATLGLGGRRYMSFWSFDVTSTNERDGKRARRRGRE